MRRHPAPACSIVLLVAVAACASGASDNPSDSSWVGTISTEGSVTTVVNESGSVWGGTATLEEVASIGVEEGDDPYMLGRIDSLWASAEEIFALDTQANLVRVYDYEGVFLRDIGAPGQGPGEFGTPFSIAGDGAGRLVVADAGNGRISFFGLDGSLLEEWPVGRLWCCVVPMVVTPEGVPYLQVLDPEVDYQSPYDFSMRAFGPEGAHGPWLRAPEFDVPDHRFRFQARRPDAPFAPRAVWVLTPGGDVVAGGSHEYRFEIRRADGSVTVVERGYEPIPVDPDEREWWRRFTLSVYRRGEPGWTWDGAEIPAAKPAYTTLWPTADGNLWAIRPGPGRRLPECDPNASIDDYAGFQEARCWRDTELVDAFAPDGRFLGAIDVPDQINLRFALPWVSGDTVIANYYDEAGTIMVKRYRLVTPQE